MYSLIKTKDDHVLEIYFDYMESIDPLGPFSDIVTAYSEITGIKPKQSDFLFNCKFVENGRAIWFYWNNGFTIYVYDIGKTQYQHIYERLYRICADLNKQLVKRRYADRHKRLTDRD